MTYLDSTVRPPVRVQFTVQGRYIYPTSLGFLGERLDNDSIKWHDNRIYTRISSASAPATNASPNPSANTRTTAPSSQQAQEPPSIPSSLLPGAAIQMYWLSFFTKCGDSHFVAAVAKGTLESTIIEVRGFKVAMEPEPITEADRLNGLEWKGNTRADGSASRIVDSQGPGTWRDGLSAIRWATTERITRKLTGKWTFTPELCMR